ncbi:unnamed protein product [Effrenium voratum]|uniref:DNA replication factor Cdt1 C-terminal domain-containing protein n=1 Tax=Effrenium voratum TaxID=2562239 RepID=A0AA36JG14_9DINO|nr:unnamed protein product [Effrenium voratum]
MEVTPPPRKKATRRQQEVDAAESLLSKSRDMPPTPVKSRRVLEQTPPPAKKIQRQKEVDAVESLLSKSRDVTPTPAQSRRALEQTPPPKKKTQRQQEVDAVESLLSKSRDVTPTPAQSRRALQQTPPPKKKTQRQQEMDAVESLLSKSRDMTPPPVKSRRVLDKAPPSTKKTSPPSEVSGKDKLESSPLQDEKVVTNAAQHAKLDDERRSLLGKLFQGIESVLQLRASRYRHTPVDTLRECVEACTGRDLTMDRLQQVLALAEGMLEAVWIGSDKPYLAVEQRAGGKLARPQGAEVAERSAKFRVAMEATAVPRKELPACPVLRAPEAMEPKPEAPVDPQAGEAVAAKVAELAKLPALKCTGSTQQRMMALRARVAAKKAIVDTEASHEAEFVNLQSRVSSCEDALAARAVLVRLFAYSGEGKEATVNEKKILSALCSCSFNEQCTRLVSVEAGKSALARLKELGDGVWFSVVQAKHSDDTFWRLILGGDQDAVRTALMAEMQKLQEEKRKLVSMGWCQAAMRRPWPLEAMS